MKYVHHSKECALILALVCSAPLQMVCAQVRENVLKPYEGPSIPGADPETLTGKVMTGYQGWFNCEGHASALQSPFEDLHRDAAFRHRFETPLTTSTTEHGETEEGRGEIIPIFNTQQDHSIQQRIKFHSSCPSCSSW